MAYRIKEDACISCGSCMNECPFGAIKKGEKCYIIDPELCMECGACAAVCPKAAPNIED